MSIFERIANRLRNRNEDPDEDWDPYEYCPRCYANLTLQEGYSAELPYWVCKGCGEMLINPENPDGSEVAWICDGCGAMLNVQEGFDVAEEGEWICTECGFSNKIDPNEVYESEAEYQAYLRDPYKGMSDEDVLELSRYEEIERIGERGNVLLCRDKESGEKVIKKLLDVYDMSVYEYLKENPIKGMPKIKGFFVGDNRLAVIEEYVGGRTLESRLQEELIPQKKAVAIVRGLCEILDSLHNLPKPIIHRDIKPSNVIMSEDDTVYLLDMNIAKWYDPEKSDDTHHMGTEYYAAPEQAGYGMKASSPKSDIYAVGMLLNVMVTGVFPKERMPDGPLREIIERCISLDAESRYSARELIGVLNEV